VTVGPRDRDAAGRARNARPRDAAGRPLPRDAAGAPRIPEDARYEPAAALAEGQRLLDGGRPFPAHEVFESVWKNSPESERDLWQALAQAAVGVTHLQRGNRTGAATLLRRAADRLSPYLGSRPHGVAVDELCGELRSAATQVDRGETGLPALHIIGSGR
jgi:hypothetical protein